ncbi:MAG: GAF domain-containing protein [Bacteroidales bacterium]
MNSEKKKSRYTRIIKQIKELLTRSENKRARMATITAVLHHKMDYFFWTGFYLLDEQNNLVVSNYQGPVACMELKKNVGVCWEAVNKKETIVVEDVAAFPGHIACDSRSKSEIVVPLKNYKGEVIGVLDVDSKDLNSFDQVDRHALEAIIALI